MKPGKRSSAELSIIALHPQLERLEPPPGLTRDERAMFQRVVLSCSPDHFARSDADTLVSFVQATMAVRMIHRRMMKSRDPKIFSQWEKAMIMHARLSTRLRLTPQSRTDPKTIARRSRDQRPPSVYDTMSLEDDDD